jgi:hypothetical protein
MHLKRLGGIDFDPGISDCKAEAERLTRERGNKACVSGNLA